jgi:hypothetical protein
MVGAHMDDCGDCRRHCNQWLLDLISKDIERWETKLKTSLRKLKKLI